MLLSCGAALSSARFSGSAPAATQRRSSCSSMALLLPPRAGATRLSSSWTSTAVSTPGVGHVGTRHRRQAVRQRLCVSSSYEAPTMDDLKLVAYARGVDLRLETFGPSFKVICTSLNDTEADPLGVLEGFVAPPFKLLHLDSIRIFNSRILGSKRSRTQTPFGLSLLLGGMAFLYARDQGCTKAELLAIDDDNGYAERLVSYYQRLGWVPVLKVGSTEGIELTDVPHMLVWGGVGTRMDADIPELIEKWARAVLSRKAAPGTLLGKASSSMASAGGEEEEERGS